jgi:hypothetical protein
MYDFWLLIFVSTKFSYAWTNTLSSLIRESAGCQDYFNDMLAPTDIDGALRTQNHAMCVPIDRNDDTCMPIEQYHSVNDTAEPLDTW